MAEPKTKRSDYEYRKIRFAVDPEYRKRRMEYQAQYYKKRRAADPVYAAAHREYHRKRASHKYRTDPVHAEKVRACTRRCSRKRLGIPEALRPAPAFCECCNNPERNILKLDHDHVSGAFRGWLCNSCNMALGQLGDSLPAVERAAAYLRRALETA